MSRFGLQFPLQACCYQSDGLFIYRLSSDILRLEITTLTLEYVNVIQLEALEAKFNRIENMLPAQAILIHKAVLIQSSKIGVATALGYRSVQLKEGFEPPSK